MGKVEESSALVVVVGFHFRVQKWILPFTPFSSPQRELPSRPLPTKLNRRSLVGYRFILHLLQHNNNMTTMLFLLLICMVLLPQAVQCYTNHAPLAFARVSNNDKRSSTVTMHAAASEDDQSNDEDGARLAAELFKAAQDRGIQLDEEGLDEEDEEEEDADDVEEEEDEGEPNIPQGAINAFLGYETNPDVGGLAGNVSITDSELYSAVKERVLDTAGGFVDFVRKADDEDDDDDENDDTLATDEPYTPPETIPDPELTAGEVVMLVLTALSNNDNPTPNQGVQVLFGFSSPHSQIKNDNTLTPDEYADFLQDE